MTENEAIERIRSGICNEIGTQRFCRDSCMYGIDKCAYSMAIQALTEIQKYRAIGTVEELINTQIREKVLNVELESYKEIGTIEDFKALNEEVELYRNLDKTNFSDGYNRAIDEFAGRLKGKYPIMENDLFTVNDVLHRKIDEIAEQMKGGAE